MPDFPQGTEQLYGHLGVDRGSAPENPGEPAIDPSAVKGEDSDQLLVDEQPEPVLSHDKKTNTVTINLTQMISGKIGKSFLVYAGIFVIGFIAYLVLFTNFSVSNLLHRAPSTSTSQANANVILSGAVANAYNAWIQSYFFDVSDPKILDPNYDISGNGLTNYQKFLLGLNPKKQDTLGLGMTDTQALISGIDPLTGGPETDIEKQIIAQNIDLEAISNKLSLAAAQNTPQVLGANTENRGQQQVSINTSVNGEVDIPSLKIRVPLIWTQDPKNFDSDLQNGLVHYPGTAMPGEIGTAYISGHSSNYSWAKGSYNKVFATLGNLKQYDSFTVKVTTTDGKTVTLHYVVTGSQIFSSSDQKQFENTGKSVVALSTCWPVGTSAQRLVVFGELSQIEN